jgi:hypothetical protein
MNEEERGIPMNVETKAVADFLSTEGTYTNILTILQEAQSDEQAAQQIENYVIKQRRGPAELYQSFERDNRDFRNVDWVEVAQAFKTD